VRNDSLHAAKALLCFIAGRVDRIPAAESGAVTMLPLVKGALLSFKVYFSLPLPPVTPVTGEARKLLAESRSNKRQTVVFLVATRHYPGVRSRELISDLAWNCRGIRINGIRFEKAAR
jgi:hypothetical protein